MPPNPSNEALIAAQRKIAELRAGRANEPKSAPQPVSVAPTTGPATATALAVAKFGSLWRVVTIEVPLVLVADEAEVAGPARVTHTSEGDVKSSTLYQFKAVAARRFWVDQ